MIALSSSGFMSAALPIPPKFISARAYPAQHSDELRLLAAAEAAGIGVWCWNLTTNRVEWDARCGELFGLPALAELEYERFFEVLHPDDRAATQEAVINAAEHGRDYDMVHRVVWSDRSVHWLRCKGGLISKGGARCLTGIATEVTWLRRMDDLLRLNERLSASADLAYALAHEINNPLEVLSNALYLLKISPLSPQQERFLQAATDAYDRTAEITRNLRSLTPRTAEVSELDLKSCLEAVLAHFREPLARQSLSVDLQCNAGGRFYCAEADIRQVLSVILENAIESV